MKPRQGIYRLGRAVIAVQLLLSCSLLPARGQVQGMRNWTDVTGRVVEAALVSVNESSITIKLGNGQVATVEKARLSQKDLDYLKQAPAITTVAPRPALGKENEPVFFSCPVDPKAWKQSDPIKTLGITNYDFETQVETPHLIVTGGNKVRDSYLMAHAETGERLFYQLQSDIPVLAKQLEGRKLGVWLSANIGDHRKVGRALDLIGKTDLNWDTTAITYLRIDEEVREKHSLLRHARGFNLEYKRSDQSKIRWCERIHFMTSTFTGSVMPYYNSEDRASWDLFQLSYSYYLERLIGGRIETKVQFAGDANLVEGFKYGWEGVTKKLLAKTPLKPSIAKFTTLDSGDAEPIDMAFGYGLIKYLFSDPQRKARLNDLFTMCLSEKKTATAADYVKVFGAASVEDFDAKWYAYLTGPEF